MMRTLLRAIWEHKLGLCLAALFLTNVGVGPDGYDAKKDPSCEDCEKEVEAIIFSPTFLKVIHAREGRDDPEAATATYSGKAANWIVTDPPSRGYVQLFDWNPKLNSKTTTVEVVGDEDFFTGRHTRETKLKMTALPVDPEENFLFNSRWLTIYARSPQLRWSSPAAYPDGRYFSKWNPVLAAGERKIHDLLIEDTPAWRNWSIDEAPGFQTEAYSVEIRKGAGKNDFFLTLTIAPDFWDKPGRGPDSKLGAVFRLGLTIRSPGFSRPEYAETRFLRFDVLPPSSF